MSQVQGGGSSKQRWEITRALIKMFIVWIDMYGVTVMLWMKQWKCKGHLITAHWGSPVTGNESKGSKTIPALRALEASWAARLQEAEKPLELARMDLNRKLDFQETAHGWEQTERLLPSLTDIKWLRRGASCQCRAVPGLWWGRVIKPESSERQQGEEGNEDRCSEIVWDWGKDDFLFFQLYLYQKCIQHHLTEAGSKVKWKG